MPDPERKTQNPQQRLEKGKRLPLGCRMPVGKSDWFTGEQTLFNLYEIITSESINMVGATIP